MGYNNYNDFMKEFNKLGDLGRNEEALNILESAEDNLSQEEYQNYFANIMHDKARYQCRCKKYERAFETISCLVEKGFACGSWLLNILPFREEKRFITLEEKNNSLLKKARISAKSKYTVYLPEGYTADRKYPLFLALHGGGENIEILEQYWGPEIVLDKGFIFVYVQSSQISWEKGFNWNDPIIARKDIMECYESVTREYSVDRECVLIGGFCGGAIATVDAAMADIFPLKGFIALSPDEKPESFTKENVQKAIERGLKGVFTEGELFMPVPDEEEMMKIFNETGFLYEFYVNHNVGLLLPDDLPEKLSRAIDFILK